MPSRTKSEIARANGAKSQGPATPAGRARSSQNALRHGLSTELRSQIAAEQVILPSEDLAEFEQFRASYIERFQPSGRPEMELVETLAVTRWRLRRLLLMESKLFEREWLVSRDALSKQFADISETEKTALIFDQMANHNQSLPLLIRYEGHLTRTYERARKELQLLQETRPAPPSVDPPPAASQKLRNEPRLEIVPARSQRPELQNEPLSDPPAPPVVDSAPDLLPEKPA
jgi:hypothetical protein